MVRRCPPRDPHCTHRRARGLLRARTEGSAMSPTPCSTHSWREGKSTARGRRRGAPVPHADGNRFVAFAQNHDHVGNRAVGDRLVHQVGVETAMVAAALVAFSPFTPLLVPRRGVGSIEPVLLLRRVHRSPARRCRASRARKEFAGVRVGRRGARSAVAGDVHSIAARLGGARPSTASPAAATGIAICSRCVEPGQSSQTVAAISCPSTRSTTTCSWYGAGGSRCWR